MPALPRGILIALEGIDGAGKTTQAAALANRLRSLDFEVVASKEPTNGPWGQKIRASANGVRMPPQEELHAFMEDRRAHVVELISPALNRGAIVIIDRYYYSNAAYQGVRGFDVSSIIRDNEAFAPRPDLLAILKVPVEVGLRRIRERGDVANEFEQKDALERSAEVFGGFAGEHVLHVDGREPASTVTAEILDRLYQAPLFKTLCLKSDLEHCEPAYCSYRERCRYIQLGQLSPVVITATHRIRGT